MLKISAWNLCTIILFMAGRKLKKKAAIMWNRNARQAYSKFCRLRFNFSGTGKAAARTITSQAKIPKRIIALGGATVAIGAISIQTAHLSTKKPRRRRHTRKSGNELCKAVKAVKIPGLDELFWNFSFVNMPYWVFN